MINASLGGWFCCRSLDLEDEGTERILREVSQSQRSRLQNRFMHGIHYAYFGMKDADSTYKINYNFNLNFKIEFGFGLREILGTTMWTFASTTISRYILFTIIRWESTGGMAAAEKSDEFRAYRLVDGDGVHVWGVMIWQNLILYFILSSKPKSYLNWNVRFLYVSSSQRSEIFFYLFFVGISLPGRQYVSITVSDAIDERRKLEFIWKAFLKLFHGNKMKYKMNAKSFLVIYLQSLQIRYNSLNLL